ncbi:MAG: serine hydrolase [Bacteroidota bacterium]
MKNLVKLLTITVLLLIISIAHAQKAKVIKEAPADVSKDRVVQEITRLSVISGGVLGLSAIHVETGKRISQNEQGSFPMASSYKIPIAIELFNKIDSGKLALDQLIPIETSDLHPGSGLMSERFSWPGNTKPPLALSVRSLLELMLLISDNSATDVCLRLAGGPLGRERMHEETWYSRSACRSSYLFIDSRLARCTDGPIRCVVERPL